VVRGVANRTVTFIHPSTVVTFGRSRRSSEPRARRPDCDVLRWSGQFRSVSSLMPKGSETR
jgi:hypothetical protein